MTEKADEKTNKRQRIGGNEKKWIKSMNKFTECLGCKNAWVHEQISNEWIDRKEKLKTW